MKSVKSIFAVAITLLFATSCQDESVSPATEQSTTSFQNTYITYDDITEKKKPFETKLDVETKDESVYVSPVKEPNTAAIKNPHIDTKDVIEKNGILEVTPAETTPKNQD